MNQASSLAFAFSLTSALAAMLFAPGPAQTSPAESELANFTRIHLDIGQSGVDRFRLEIFRSDSREPLFDSGIVKGSKIDFDLPSETLGHPSLTYELRTWDSAGELITSQISQLSPQGGSAISTIDFELIPGNVSMVSSAIQLDAPTNITGDLDVQGITRTGELRNSLNTAFVETCAIGTSLRSIAANGSVICETDDLHNHTATDNLRTNGHWLSGDGGDEGIFINNVGNIGIGTNILTDAKLRIEDLVEGRFAFNFATGIPTFRLATNDTDPVVISMEAPTGNYQLRVTSDNELHVFTSSPIMTFDSLGRVGIGNPDPSFRLHLGTDSAAKPGSSSWTIASDARLKDVQEPFARGLEALVKLQPVSFHYKAGNDLNLPSEKIYVGLLAQEVAAVIPEAVQTGPGGFLHLETDAILWTMLNAIRQLEIENRNLRSAFCGLEEAAGFCDRNLSDDGL